MRRSRLAFLFLTLAGCSDPSGPPVSDRPIYFALDGGSVFSLARVPADGSADPTPLGVTGIWPSVSASGNHLGYVVEGTCCTAFIRSLADNGTTSLAGPDPVGRIDLSPDGTVALLGFDGELGLRAVSSTDVDTVTENVAPAVYYAAWSPNGQTILATSGDVALDADIWRFAPHGTATILIDGGTGSARDPAWSPDGTRIAYSLGKNERFSIWVADADGSNATRITNDTGAVADLAPAWSPDGRHIAFHRNRSICTVFCQMHTDVFVMAANGSGIRNLTPNTDARAIGVTW